MKTKMSNVSSRRGAPMGRREYRNIHPTLHSVKCARVDINLGGYDNGGAYWGRGNPLFMLSQDIEMVDHNGNLETFCTFIRATCRWHALIKSGLALDMFKVLQMDKRYTITREFVGIPTSQFVVRFCDEWVNSSSDKSKALEIVRQHVIGRKVIS